MYTNEAIAETLQDLNTVETAEELAVYKSEIEEAGMLDNEMIINKLAKLDEKFASQHKPTLEEQVAELKAQIAQMTQLMQAGAKTQIVKELRVKPAQKWYIAGFENVSKWTKKQQVFSLADILKSTDAIGAVVTDSDIVAAVEAFAGKKLHTTQPPKRIWDYYKGNSNDGFLTHGCINYANDKDVTHVFDPETNKFIAIQ